LPWDENGNVCTASVEAANLGQPLTRSHCEQAGMSWDDGANVCTQSAKEAHDQPLSTEVSPLLINIDKATQTMTVVLNGEKLYEWPVSTGLRGYSTPAGTYTASSMNKIWYSKEWDNAPMPHAVFFTEEGHAIHGTYEVKRLGKPASHGCVRIAPKNAAALYDLVAKTGLQHTQVVLTGTTPGGEGKLVRVAKAKSTVAKSKATDGRASRSFKRRNNAYAENFRPRRARIFRRFFGRL
jgi:hypothetical protein